ncbi:MAG TPA: dephospho-CoA kinase [Rectinemataceae bacterium]|nr:dephospho-CoA kinase [Rectinemataceae bacterium]
MLLGLTGGYCAGKNTAGDFLERRGWASIDVDKLGHQALELARDEVVGRFDAVARSRFGKGLLDERGGLDRRLLGAIVFSEPRLLGEHEAIVHPIMYRLVDEAAADLSEAARSRGESGARVVINAAILYKMPILASCEAVIEVRAPLLRRLARAKARDGLGFRKALERIGRQGALWRLRPRDRPPVLVLRNDGDAKKLERRLEALLAEIGPE